MSRHVIDNPSLPAPMRRGAFSSGVEAPAGRTIYVSGQVSVYPRVYKQSSDPPRPPESRRGDEARSEVDVIVDTYFHVLPGMQEKAVEAMNDLLR